LPPLLSEVEAGHGVPGPLNDPAELAEPGAGDEAIVSIAGHVSLAMLSRYSHVRMDAKRRVLDEIAARRCAAGEKRKKEAEQRQVTAEAQSAVVQ